jgi:hypothetical protein
MKDIFEGGLEISGLGDNIEAQNTSIDDLESENVNLMMIGIDCSGSMYKYSKDMVNCLTEFKTALAESKESNEILIARADFEDDVKIGGYKAIDEFDTGFKDGGCTAMYDCIVQGSQKMLEYRKYLRDQGVRVKCVFAIFSDGYENGSSASLSMAKQAVANLNNEEITTAFISFGNDAQQEATTLGFKNLLTVSSSASELRRAFNCLSKSVIESSKSVMADGDAFFV